MGAEPAWALLGAHAAVGGRALARRVSPAGFDTLARRARRRPGGRRHDARTADGLGRAGGLRAGGRGTACARVRAPATTCGSAARPGDAAAGLAILQGRLDAQGRARDALLARFQLPQARVALGIALRGIATSCIDISDGLRGRPRQAVRGERRRCRHRGPRTAAVGGPVLGRGAGCAARARRSAAATTTSCCSARIPASARASQRIDAGVVLRASARSRRRKACSSTAPPSSEMRVTVSTTSREGRRLPVKRDPVHGSGRFDEISSRSIRRHTRAAPVPRGAGHRNRNRADHHAARRRLGQHRRAHRQVRRDPRGRARLAPAPSTSRTIPTTGATSRSRRTASPRTTTRRGRKVARKMFLSEAHMVGMLQHPNIMPIYDAGEENGYYYVVTEFIHGARTLAAYTRPDNLLPVEDVLTIMFKCAKALHYAHSRGVIHRDIKPSNLMLTTDSDVQAHRLRHRAAQRRRFLAHRGHRRQPQLHVARAGAVARADQPLRPLFAGRGHVRVADRAPAVPRRRARQAAAPDRLRDAAADALDPRRTSRRSWRTWSRWRCTRSRTSATRTARSSPNAIARVHAQQRKDTDRTDRQEHFNLLRRLKFFHDFSSDEIWEVLRAGTWQRHAPGDEIVRAGGIDDRFYVIVTGACRVERDGAVVGRLEAGDCFGETSYLRGAKRQAAVHRRRRRHDPARQLDAARAGLVGLPAALQQGVPQGADLAPAERRVPRRQLSAITGARGRRGSLARAGTLCSLGARRHLARGRFSASADGASADRWAPDGGRSGSGVRRAQVRAIARAPAASRSGGFLVLVARDARVGRVVVDRLEVLRLDHV